MVVVGRKGSARRSRVGALLGGGGGGGRQEAEAQAQAHSLMARREGGWA